MTAKAQYKPLLTRWIKECGRRQLKHCGASFGNAKGFEEAFKLSKADEFYDRYIWALPEFSNEIPGERSSVVASSGALCLYL